MKQLSCGHPAQCLINEKCGWCSDVDYWKRRMRSAFGLCINCGKQPSSEKWPDAKLCSACFVDGVGQFLKPDDSEDIDKEREMERLADQIFDAVIEAASIVHRADEIAKKKAQINSVTSRRCGNCGKWMTSYCIPEKKHGRFKSMNSTGCSDFVLSGGSTRLYDEFQIELEVIICEGNN